ncbi:PTS lactose/cellobiose transporter subunit IIA [Lentilactobacillus raoultii]|uniref:PTS lactose/cellobiose transporter subunit IIA n=1 Tax=Lentilactobacillus raoultii TaxID=1987503 RepID=A0ABW3PCZ7_9LACO|nr:PTS lactose/cellobiose transporter subunit IIA [Lentilactobacillus raoultii]
MNANQLNQLSMKILMDAGHAKTELAQLLDDLETTTPDQHQIDQKLGNAAKWLKRAHLQQNKVMQQAEQLTYSILLTHAQDTLMNTETIYFLVKRFVPIILKSKN